MIVAEAIVRLLAGHSDPRWLQAVTEQAATLVHTSNLFHSVPQVCTGCGTCLLPWHMHPLIGKLDVALDRGGQCACALGLPVAHSLR